MRKTIILIIAIAAAASLAACGGGGDSTSAPATETRPAAAKADLSFCAHQAAEFKDLRRRAETIKLRGATFADGIAFTLDSGRLARVWLASQLLEDPLLVVTAQAVDATLTALPEDREVDPMKVDMLLVNLDRFEMRCETLQGH